MNEKKIKHFMSGISLLVVLHHWAVNSATKCLIAVLN